MKTDENENILMKQHTVCFTGHRRIRKKDALSLQYKLSMSVQSLIAGGYSRFLAGGARGFDMIAARLVLQFQENNSSIKLILILPFRNQSEHEAGWTKAEIAEYQALKEAATEVIHLRENYTRGCYHQRDRFLVDASTVCIAYLSSSSGGTAYTVRYAEEQGLQVINCAAKINGLFSDQTRCRYLARAKE